jgi:hypothetical protein
MISGEQAQGHLATAIGFERMPVLAVKRPRLDLRQTVAGGAAGAKTEDQRIMGGQKSLMAV